MDCTTTESWDTGDGEVRWARLGAGPAVVLTHGTPFSSFIWRDIAPVLARDHTVYVWDMLGFGASSAHPRDLSLRRQARILADLLGHWGLGPGPEAPRMIAHDVGGAVALRAALLHGATYRQLTLVDAAVVDRWGSGGFFQAVSANPEAFTALPDWASDALIAAKLDTGSHPGLRPEARDSYLAQWSRPGGREAFYRQYAQGGEENLADIQHLLPTLDMPIDVIWGARDRWLSLDYGRRAHAALPPHARFDVIDGAGHAVPEDRPGELLRLLTRER